MESVIASIMVELGIQPSVDQKLLVDQIGEKITLTPVNTKIIQDLGLIQLCCQELKDKPEENWTQIPIILSLVKKIFTEVKNTATAIKQTSITVTTDDVIDTTGILIKLILLLLPQTALLVDVLFPLIDVSIDMIKIVLSEVTTEGISEGKCSSLWGCFPCISTKV